MNENVFLDKVPQSVLLTGTDLASLFQFFKDWAARLLQTSSDVLEQHPDFHCIRPTNKMRQIQVDALRTLNREVYMSAQQGGHKVFGLVEADRLHTSAANAMLKTLEEPSPNTSIFLITTKPYYVLPTLRSRCWWIRVTASNAMNSQEEALEPWLEAFKEKVTLYLKTGKALNPLQIYGLLYRFQTYLTQQQAHLKTNSEDLSEEELEAQKAGYEKQLIQEAFQQIEIALSTLFHSEKFNPNPSLFYQWIQVLETCYKRTEVNFGAVQALESFLLQLLKHHE